MIKDRLYIKYAQDVVSGNRIACENIILACKRMLNWFDRNDIYFDYDDVDRKIKLVSKLKHYKGDHNGKPFILLDWQQWIVANIYGWKWKEDNTRVTQNVFIFVSRKNGKTALAAALALIGVVGDGEMGAEVDLVANSRQQAAIAFDMCSEYAHSVDPNDTVFKRYRDSIKVPRKKSIIQILCSDSMANDGYNSSLAIIDEFHAQKDWGLYNVMKSSQGMRKNPLTVIITTAGFLLHGYPCYEMRQSCIDILRGLKTDDTYFPAIFELDANDDWTDEKVWEKCCPSLNQTVRVKYMRDQVNAALNTSCLETGVLTKNFNKFCATKDVWIPDDYLKNAFAPVDLSDYKGELAYMGTDLSEVSDLTANAILFPPNPNREVYPDKFVFINDIFIPECAIHESVNGEMYKNWIKQNFAQLTSGNVVDYDYILKKQLEYGNTCLVDKLFYDSYNAGPWAIDATTMGMPIEPCSQSLGNFNKATKSLEVYIRRGDVVIQNNPAVRWCFNNVELKRDHNNNCKPIKAGDVHSRKIDPVIAMLQALIAYMSSPHFDQKLFVV